MQCHIGIAVSEQTFLKRYLDAAQYQVSLFGEPVYVVLTFAENLLESVHIEREGESQRLVEG